MEVKNAKQVAQVDRIFDSLSVAIDKYMYAGSTQNRVRDSLEVIRSRLIDRVMHCDIAKIETNIKKRRAEKAATAARIRRHDERQKRLEAKKKREKEELKAARALKRASK